MNALVQASDNSIGSVINCWCRVTPRVLILNDRVAIVVGASSSCDTGHDIVVALAQMGIKLVIADRVPQGNDKAILDLERMVAEARAVGAEAIGMNLDICDEKQIRECINDVQERFGRIDVLVLNAHSSSDSDGFMNVTSEQWRESLVTAVIGMVNLCRCAIPVMVKQNGGSVINITASKNADVIQNYIEVTTRHAVIGISQALAHEFDSHNVRINVVSPDDAVSSADTFECGTDQFDEDGRQWYEAITEHFGEPVAVGNAVAFLASDAASSVSGINLPVGKERTLS